MSSEHLPTTETYYLRKSEVLDALHRDGLALLSPSLGRYYSVNRCAEQIWRLFAQPRCCSDLVDALTHDYDVSPQQCRREVEDFVRQLHREGLLSVARPPSSPQNRIHS